MFTSRRARDNLDTGSRDADNQRSSQTKVDEEIEEIICELESVRTFLIFTLYH